jgi:hypothetical protein
VFQRSQIPLTDALKYGVSSNLALYSLSILNASSVFGRIIPNWLADTCMSTRRLLAFPQR